MKIQDFKALNMKGKMVDVKIKKYDVSNEHKDIVEDFIDYIDDIGFPVDIENKDNIAKQIQENCYFLLKKTMPIQIEEIDCRLSTLNIYFDLTQIKYFKIAGVLSAYRDYVRSYPSRMMKRYFDNYQTIYI